VPSTLYCTFVRDLPADPAQVLARMPKKARAEARKAREKHGLELSQGHWYTDDLQRMFLLNKRELGSPGLPAAHFRAILEQFERGVFVHLVRQGGTPLAAVMSFAFQGTLIAYYAGAQPGADRSVSASNFMYMALQEWAVERGFQRFDFCRSRVDSGAFEFKRHQGFEPTPLHYGYHLVRRRSLPSFTPSNPRTAVLRSAWSRMPLWLASSLSERLARYLP
jgi:predicted N-acyltransferase